MESFSGEARKYLSCVTVENDQEVEKTCSVKFLNKSTAGSALPDHKLKPKMKVNVMPHRNIDPSKRNVNGAGYTLRDKTSNTLHLTLATE